MEDKLNIGVRAHGDCWLCGKQSLEVLMDPIDRDPSLIKSPVLICRACGFIQKRPYLPSESLKKILETSYYANYDDTGIVRRSRDRALVDFGRNVEYVEHISPHVNWKEVHRALDIGGAEGLFSHVLKKMHPHVEVYCLEPDRRVTAVGKNLYPEVHFLENRLEDLATVEEGSFDLITYWGGFYRTVFPQKAMREIHAKTTEDGIIGLSIPMTLDRPENQADDPLDSIDELLGCFRNGIFLLLNDFYMEAFMRPYFENIAVEKKQNYPFLKEIPFHIGKKKEASTLFQCTVEHKNLHRDNREYVLEFANRETRARLARLCRRHEMNRIAIFGAGKEAEILARFAVDLGLEDSYIVDPYCREVVDVNGLPVKRLSAIFRDEPDAVIISDFERQNATRDQFLNRVHLDRRVRVVSGFKLKEYPNKRACFELDGRDYLQKSFSFTVE